MLLSEQECFDRAGRFQGNCTNCAHLACDLAGACCLPDGSCGQLTLEGCDAFGGAWVGAGIACGAGVCTDEPDCPADLSGDGSVGFDDVLLILSNWGTICP